MAYNTTMRAASHARGFQATSLLSGVALSLGLAAILDGIPPASADSGRPRGLIEIEAPEPLEISGIAAVPGGYAVVGNETGDHGRIWPGGGTWDIDPPVKGPESLDVEIGPAGERLWLILDEDNRTLTDLNGGRYRFPDRFQEVCGRGLEGLALRWNHGWEVAALWEGGFYKPDCDEAPAAFAKPRVAILHWVRGQGTQGPESEFELTTEEPSGGQRFRAPDLVWNGDNLLVLLGSLSANGRPYEHTWLQNFDLNGNPVGHAFKLEERWGGYRDGKNWEALDWSLDGTHLAMGFDAEKGRRVLAVFLILRSFHARVYSITTRWAKAGS